MASLWLLALLITVPLILFIGMWPLSILASTYSLADRSRSVANYIFMSWRQFSSSNFQCLGQPPSSIIRSELHEDDHLKWSRDMESNWDGGYAWRQSAQLIGFLGLKTFSPHLRDWRFLGISWTNYRRASLDSGLCLILASYSSQSNLL